MEMEAVIEVVLFMSLREGHVAQKYRADGPPVKRVSGGPEALGLGPASGVGWGETGPMH